MQQHFLHKQISFVILTSFAFADTAIVLSSDIGAILTANYSIGIAFSLIVGKPLGIFLITFIVSAFGFSDCQPTYLGNRLLVSVFWTALDSQ